MPLYEYWCPECKKTFEKLQPMGSRNSSIKCARCGALMKKMLSVFATVGRATEGQSYFMGGSGGCGCGGNCACGRQH